MSATLLEVTEGSDGGRKRKTFEKISRRRGQSEESGPMATVWSDLTGVRVAYSTLEDGLSCSESISPPRSAHVL